MEQWYDPNIGYIGPSKLWKKLSDDDKKGLNYNQFKNNLNNQYAYQLTKKFKKPKVFNTIYAHSPRDNYQIDIIVYDRYTYNNYKYILVCIDVHSRYLQCRAMTNRTNETIIKNLKDIFDVMGVCRIINCDNEFNKTKINDLFQKLDIRVKFSQPDEINKNAIVERVNGTIASMLQRWRVATNKYNWHAILPSIVDNYNNTYHSTIKALPKDVFNFDDTNKQTIIKLDNSFKVGDKVRTKIRKKVFDKGDILTNSKTIYLIDSIDKNKITIRNTETDNILKTTYKPQELTKIQDIQYKPNVDSNDEQIHINQQKEIKQKRAIKKAGIEKYDDIDLGKRTRKIKRDDVYQY